MNYYAVQYDQARLNLASVAAEEEERQRAIQEDDPEESTFQPAVLAEFYKYRRISEPYTARLLALEPGRDAQPLQGHLTSLALGQQQEYSALSYVWGPPVFSQTILLGGKRLAITESLYAALRHFRLSQAVRYIWIDQICINQKDIIERNKQVKLMYAIYRDATQILVWLGPDEQNLAPKAFQLCRSICSILDDDLLSSLCRKAGADFDWIPKKYWKALRELTQISWFRRVWIPQEIGTETPAQIHWGTSKIGWDVLGESMKKLDNVWELKKAHGIETDIITSLHRRFVRPLKPIKNGADGEFVYQLFLSARNQATDPRDYIFSQLGHHSAWVASEESIIIEPDYDNTVQAIYHELAIRVLKTSCNLLILNVTANPAQSIQRSSLPSWVPRWNEGRFDNLIGYPNRYGASKSRSHGARFENDFKHLILDGIFVDNITKILEPFPPLNFSPRSSTIQLLESAWKVVCSTFTGQSSSTRFRTDLKYLSSATDALEAFLDVLAPAKCVASISPATASYASGIAALAKLFPTSAQWGREDPRKLVDAKDSIAKPSIWMQVAGEHSRNRRFAITKKGYMVMAPPTALKGDSICVLYGGETPYVLRPLGNAEGYRFMGEAYVPGLMGGEALIIDEPEKVHEKSFCIR
ncbi:putative Heterokaryon incompatibility protein-domain-containing protein [Seiridium cardinale]